MGWFYKFIRVVGAANPVSAMLNQLQAELDSEEFHKRIRKFEDPVSHLHRDVPKISELIYSELTLRDSVNLSFGDDFYEKYGRVLAMLETKSFLSVERAAGHRMPIGVNLTEPSYIAYMCALVEDRQKMEGLIELLEKCEAGRTLNAESLSEEIGLAKYVIRAFFQIYASNGFGYCSGGIKQFKYTAMN